MLDPDRVRCPIDCDRLAVDRSVWPIGQAMLPGGNGCPVRRCHLLSLDGTLRQIGQPEPSIIDARRHLSSRLGARRTPPFLAESCRRRLGVGAMRRGSHHRQVVVIWTRARGCVRSPRSTTRRRAASPSAHGAMTRRNHLRVLLLMQGVPLHVVAPTFSVYLTLVSAWSRAQ